MATFKKSLWIVTYNFHPVWAGPAERFLRYFQGFTEREIDVTYITSARQQLPEEDLYNGAKVKRLGVEQEKTPSIKQFVDLAAQAALIGPKRPDTFLVLLADPLNAKSIKLLSKNGINTIYVNTMVFKLSNAKNPLKRYLSKRLNINLLKSFDTIVCSTKVLKKPIVEAGISPNKVVVIHNGVNLGRFSPEIEESGVTDFKKELGLPKDGPVVLFVGLRVERKGVIDLVETWKIYKANGGPGYLVLVGGEQRGNKLFAEFYRDWDELLKTVKPKDQIIFHQPSKQIEKYFKASKLFVFLSKKEGMPNVLAEAMATGCPVITTKFEGFSDELGKPDQDILVVERNREKIANLINKCMTDEAYYQEIRSNALQFVKSNHDVEISLGKYSNLIYSN